MTLQSSTAEVPATASAPEFVLVQFADDSDDLSVGPLTNIEAKKTEQGRECMVKWSNKKLYKLQYLHLVRTQSIVYVHVLCTWFTGEKSELEKLANIYDSADAHNDLKEEVWINLRTTTHIITLFFLKDASCNVLLSSNNQSDHENDTHDVIMMLNFWNSISTYVYIYIYIYIYSYSMYR